MKRPLPFNGLDDKANKHPKRAEPLTLACDYIGYSFQKDPVVVETLDASTTTLDPSEFFHRFISKRKPCILQTNATTTPLLSISLQDLVTVAGTEVVQVEKRFSAQESFGQNRTKARQLLMTMQDLVDKLKTTEGELLYFSTQHVDDDNNNNPFQTPCAQLLQAKKIPPTLSWASTLRLESCNLWMGRSSSAVVGTNSGLHHDYHDNFYLLLKGRKQFRLYSPDTAHFMSTYGTIERIHFNGVISYLGSEMHADATPVIKNDSSNDDDDDDNGSEDEESEDEEEEVVLGKGFDYKSDDDDDNNAEDDEDEVGGTKVDVDGPDDFDNLEAASSPQSEEESDKKDPQQDETFRPNSFSRIDPANVDQAKFPHFGTCREYIVELTAGQILYLPAGWFHSVTSYSSTKAGDSGDDQVHMALNYWYHPPDQLDSFTKPYRRDPLKSG